MHFCLDGRICFGKKGIPGKQGNLYDIFRLDGHTGKYIIITQIYIDEEFTSYQYLPVDIFNDCGQCRRGIPDETDYTNYTQ